MSWPPEYVTLPRGDRHRLDDDGVYRAAALRVGERTFEARVFPSWTHGEVSGQVDFVASGPGIASGRVCESLATSGARWADVVEDAVGLFEEGVAPPLLAALCGAGGASRATPFTHPTAGSFALHCGPVQALYGPAEPEAMEELLDQLCARLPAEAITREAHALRAFVFVHEGRRSPSRPTASP